MRVIDMISNEEFLRVIMGQCGWDFVRLFDKLRESSSYEGSFRDFLVELFGLYPDIEFESISRKNSMYEYELHKMLQDENPVLRVKALELYSSGKLVKREVDGNIENKVRVYELREDGIKSLTGG